MMDDDDDVAATMCNTNNGCNSIGCLRGRDTEGEPVSGNISVQFDFLQCRLYILESCWINAAAIV